MKDITPAVTVILTTILLTPCLRIAGPETKLLSVTVSVKDIAPLGSTVISTGLLLTPSTSVVFGKRLVVVVKLLYIDSILTLNYNE